MRAEQRPLAHVTPLVWFTVAAALAVQIAWRAASPAPTVAAADLPPPPTPAALKLAAFGEPEALARLAMLYLQAYDYGGTNAEQYDESKKRQKKNCCRHRCGRARTPVAPSASQPRCSISTRVVASPARRRNRISTSVASARSRPRCHR